MPNPVSCKASEISFFRRIYISILTTPPPQAILCGFPIAAVVFFDMCKLVIHRVFFTSVTFLMGVTQSFFSPHGRYRYFRHSSAS